MTSYTGIYVQRTTTGAIFSVQVRDSAGIELSLNPAEYERRGVQPPMDQLPDVEDYRP